MVLNNFYHTLLNVTVVWTLYCEMCSTYMCTVPSNKCFCYVLSVFAVSRLILFLQGHQGGCVLRLLDWSRPCKNLPSIGLRPHFSSEPLFACRQSLTSWTSHVSYVLSFRRNYLPNSHMCRLMYARVHAIIGYITFELHCSFILVCVYLPLCTVYTCQEISLDAILLWLHNLWPCPMCCGVHKVPCTLSLLHLMYCAPSVFLIGSPKKCVRLSAGRSLS